MSERRLKPPLDVCGESLYRHSDMLTMLSQVLGKIWVIIKILKGIEML
jgi:hypothetical protein